MTTYLRSEIEEDNMKLPHKLDKELSDEKELRVWLNQLRDYLSDKEEASNYRVVSFSPTGETVPAKTPKYKEDSKGEKGGMRWLDRKVWFNELDGRARCAECNQIMFDVREHSCVEIKPEDIAGNYDYKVDIKNTLPIKEEKCDCPRCNPPQQEESRGEIEDKISEILKVVGFTNNDRVHGNIVRCNRDLGELKNDLLSLIKPQLKEESPKEDEWKELSDLIHDAIYGGEVRGVDIIQHINKRFVSKEKIKRVAFEMEAEPLRHGHKALTGSETIEKMLNKLGLEEL